MEGASNAEPLVADWEHFPPLARLRSTDGAESFAAWGQAHQTLWADGTPLVRAALRSATPEPDGAEIVGRAMVTFHRRIILTDDHPLDLSIPEPRWLHRIYRAKLHWVVVSFLRREPWNDHAATRAAALDNEGEASFDEVLAAFWEEMDRLSPAERAAIRDRSQGLSTARIAEKTGESQRFVLDRIFGAVTKVRAKLRDQGFKL